MKVIIRLRHFNAASASLKPSIYHSTALTGNHKSFRDSTSPAIGKATYLGPTTSRSDRYARIYEGRGLVRLQQADDRTRASILAVARRCAHRLPLLPFVVASIAATHGYSGESLIFTHFAR
ncbi:hypothetical protein KC338_g148 [Hortaea werneckii]|nr:hypothetical protein KC338_g148 [Hortaea werneckii]